MASADGLTLPKPAIPKTLGILNVIFAVLLILVGLCTGITTLIAPEIQKFGQKAMDDMKTQQEAQKTAQLKALDDREKTATAAEEKATTDEEKASADSEKRTITLERKAIESRPAPPTFNMAASADVLKDPVVRGYTVTTVITGLILHIALLIAGIGLIRLTPWGRSLGLWWAGLQIVQLLILTAVNVALVQPVQQKAAEANMAEMRKTFAGPNAPPNAEMTLQMTETMAKAGGILTIVYSLAGMIYPIICLILLRTAGARAACLARPVEKYPPPVADY